jgi:hypothetical protein
VGWADCFVGGGEGMVLFLRLCLRLHRHRHVTGIEGCIYSNYEYYLSVTQSGVQSS